MQLQQKKSLKTYFVTAPKPITVEQLLSGQTKLVSVDWNSVLKHGGVWLDKARILDPETKLKKADTLRVYLSPTQTKIFTLTKENIVFEDGELLVINKPAGVPAISDLPSLTWNATYGVRKYLAAKGNTYETTPVSRLDYFVSGLMIYPKHKQSQRDLFMLMADRKIFKQYTATMLTDRSNISNDSQTITRLRIDDRVGFDKKAKADPDGKRCKTLFVLDSKNDATLTYNVFTFTGRRHQIRFHAARYLYPLKNDLMYGAKAQTNSKGIEGIGLAATGYNFRYNNKKYRIRLFNV